MHAQNSPAATGSVRSLAIAALVLVLGLGLVAVAQPARATYPGSTDGRLAIGAEVDGNVDICTVLPNGAAVHRLTTDPLFDACPAWSADGKRLAWCHGVRARGGTIEIWSMNLDGTDKTQVTSLGGRMTFPDFSPNGSRIAFGGRLPGATNDDIFSIGSDGSGLVQLTSDPANDSLPASRRRLEDRLHQRPQRPRPGLGDGGRWRLAHAAHVRRCVRGPVPNWSPDRLEDRRTRPETPATSAS